METLGQIKAYEKHKPDVCVWRIVESLFERYETECGKDFEFSPVSIDCPYCGRRIQVEDK